MYKQHTKIDKKGNVTEHMETDAAGNVIFKETITYHSNNKIKSVKDSIGNIRHFYRDGTRKFTLQVNEKAKIKYIYNNRGHLLRKIFLIDPLTFNEEMGEVYTTLQHVMSKQNDLVTITIENDVPPSLDTTIIIDPEAIY